MNKQNKNTILVITSLIIMGVSGAANISQLVSSAGPNLINVALSIGYIAVWIAILVLARNSQGLMIYSLIISGISLIHLEEFCFKILGRHATILFDFLFMISKLLWLWVLLLDPWLGLIYNKTLYIPLTLVFLWFILSIFNLINFRRKKLISLP